LLFLFGFEFLAVTILIVYVGAVAVLFLFVLLMLNIKLAELVDNYNNIIPIGILICFLFIYQLVFLFSFNIESIGSLDLKTITFILDYSNLFVFNKLDFLLFNSTFSNLKTLAFVFYSEFLVHFLIAGLILLLAMIAAIVLTLSKLFVVKNQNIYGQILKDYNNALLHLS
jgi:NADH-quinone oxidoreductase subunit J